MNVAGDCADDSASGATGKGDATAHHAAGDIVAADDSVATSACETCAADESVARAYAAVAADSVATPSAAAPPASTMSIPFPVLKCQMPMSICAFCVICITTGSTTNCVEHMSNCGAPPVATCGACKRALCASPGDV